EMNYSELREYRDLQIDKGGLDLLRFSIDLAHKISFPLACMLMATLGFSVVVDVHARQFAVGVLTGIIVAALYYLVDALFRNLGRAGSIPIFVASWTPSILFIIVIGVLMNRLERIRH